MNTLGIYIGPEIINIAEVKGRKLINTVKIAQKVISANEFEEKVPEDIKMVALFKDEIRKNNIAAKEVNLALSGKDLIIRTFEMPAMPSEDLGFAVNFEAKKYMPFKIEELILDYQTYFDRANRKYIVLLVGVKREVFDKYLSIFQQLNLKITSLEYAAFSVFRMLKMSGIHEKGVVGIIEADLQESDEANFTALENGFPLFSRDIAMGGRAQAAAVPGEESNPQLVLEKLKAEVRVSLDYYHRKFPAKSVKKVYLIANKDYKTDLEAMVKEIGLVDCRFVDVEKHIGRPVGFSLSFLKSYSVSLEKAIKAPTRIDLIAAKTRQAQKAAAPMRKSVALTEGFRLQPLVVVLSVIICIAAFALGYYPKIPIQNNINIIKAARPVLASVKIELSNEELESLDGELRRKLSKFDQLVRKQLYLTSPFNVIPEVIPEGIWLTSFSYSNRIETNKPEAILNGTTYLMNREKEIQLINEFVSKLKSNIEFAEYFKEISIGSIQQGQFEKVAVTNFSIICKNN